jgi:RNA polymerase sigma-70 factor, ECF subfamily
MNLAVRGANKAPQDGQHLLEADSLDDRGVKPLALGLRQVHLPADQQGARLGKARPEDGKQAGSIPIPEEPVEQHHIIVRAGVREPAWQAALRQARASFPDIQIDDASFAIHAEACRERGGRPEHLPDLLLAWAAARGDAAALQRFDAHVQPDVEAAARRFDRTEAFIDEVRQALLVRLLVAPEGGRTRIAEYAGRGPLRAWVGVAALRVALNLKRDAAPAAAAEDVLAELVAGEPDPELRHLKTLYRAEFREALEVALSALPERQRAILRLSFVDGLRLAQIARLYQVHESTASRWVSQAADAVATDARRRLVARLSLSPSSVDSVARMIQSNLDLSIARILGRTPTG